MKLQFTKQAREEFLRIVSVFAEYAGPRSADKFIKRVNDRGDTAVLTLLKKLPKALKIIGETFGFLDIFL